MKNEEKIAWVELRKKAKEFEDFDNIFTAQKLVMGLSGMMGRLGMVYCSKFDDSEEDEDFEEKMMTALSDVCWYLAVLETYFDLPATVYALYIESELEKIEGVVADAESMEVAFANLMGDVKEIITCIMSKDPNEVQFALNSMVWNLIQLCIFHPKYDKLTIRTAVKYASFKMDAETIDEVEETEEESLESYEEQYLSLESMLKIKDIEEFCLEIYNKKDVYNGIVIKYGKRDKRKRKVFFEGNMVVDYFAAVSFKARNYPEAEVTMGPNLLKLVDTSDKFNLKYLCFVPGEVDPDQLLLTDEQLKEVVKSKGLPKGTTFTAFLTHNKQTTLDHVQDHVNGFRKSVIK